MTAPTPEAARSRARRGLVRQRLLSPLLDPAGARLIVVSAPAGSGKTTLLTQAAQLSPVTAVHVQVTPDCAASAITARIAAATGRHAREGLLLLDDLHEIAGTSAEPALAQLVREHGPRWRIVLGCRRAPLPELPALRLSPDVLEISGDDLRFRSWEVEELFDTVLGHPLAPEPAAALTRRTGGWAAGLTLFHLATLHHTTAQRRRSVDELGGGSRLLRSYLTRNVLADLPAARRRFLTLTCALGTLTGPLCDELLGAGGSLHTLEELAEEQLFTSNSDDGTTFRYHHVLQSHLEVALVELLGADGSRRWYARCAALLERAGMVRDALRAHARAEDWASLQQLLHRCGAGGPTQAWQDLLPAGLRTRDPWFVAADARRQLREGELASAAAGLRRAAELSDEPAFQERCRRERGLVEAWSRPGPVPGTGRHWTERLLAAVRHAPDRWAAHPDRSASDHLVTGVAHLLAGRPADAAARFAAGAGAEGGGVAVELGLELGAVVAELLGSGGLPAGQRLEAALLRAETEDHPWFARLARALAARANHAALQAECDRHDDAWGAALVTMVAGAAGLFDGPDGGDVTRLDDAADRFRALDAPVLETWCRCAAAVVLGRSGAAEAPAAARAVELAARRAQVPVAGTLARTAGVRAAPRGQAPLALTCLGGFQLASGPLAVDLAEVRPRARSLLRYLALHAGRDVHRERLVDDLWPGSTLAAGTRSLQVAVSSLRGVLGGAGIDGAAVLLRRGDAYRLQLPDGSSDDVARFRALAERARATGDAVAGSEALALYTGELLPEEGPAEWVVQERERLRLEAAATAARLARDLAELGRLPGAIEAARHAVRLDRWSDLAWLLLADLHDRAGDHSAAIRCRRAQRDVQRELLAR